MPAPAYHPPGARRAPRRLADCHSIADLRLLAARRLPRPLFHFLDGGAEDETTLNRNVSAFERYALVPRALVDVASVDMATSFMGLPLAWPVICSPTGASRFFHPAGELAVAQAAADTATLYCLSTMSTHGLDAVAKCTPTDKLFQLYIFKDKGVTRELIQRVRSAGYRALCITVDTPVPGNRERDLRSGWGVPIRPSISLAASLLARPGWVYGQLRGGRLSMPTIAELARTDDLALQSRYIAEQLSSSLSWRDVIECLKAWDGPLAIKGLMSVQDARQAAQIGVRGLFISNHGGRQLDGAATALDMLPAVIDAVGDRVDVVLDGGVRRGTHVLKALALGAKACGVGRPYLYGLGCGGQAGVNRALTILKDELRRAMQLVGCVSFRETEPTLLLDTAALQGTTDAKFA